MAGVAGIGSALTASVNGSQQAQSGADANAKGAQNSSQSFEALLKATDSSQKPHHHHGAGHAASTGSNTQASAGAQAGASASASLGVDLEA